MEIIKTKEKKIRDDYCEMLNDGFGCNDDEKYKLKYCLECKKHRLIELIETYGNLIDITTPNEEDKTSDEDEMPF